MRDLCTLGSEAIYKSLSSLGQSLGDLSVTLRHMLASGGQCSMMSNVCESLN